MFDPELTLQHMESLRQPNGAFVASTSANYRSIWLRDHLYMAKCYSYLGPNYHQKLRESMHIAFNIFHQHRHKLERIVLPRDHNNILIPHQLIHAKYDPLTLNEVTTDWGHHQIDAIGLFLYAVADLEYKNIKVCRDKGDGEIIQLLVFYLQNVEYWREPDNGIWEEHVLRHSSSIGAAVAGLSYIKRQGLAVVPHELIARGENELQRILPWESRDSCSVKEHSHDCDAAQLFLIWPFHAVNRDIADLILSRITEGHRTENREFHRLVQPMGINRYWGDGYEQSDNGVSAEWQWEFLITIIYCQNNDYETAYRWFKKGAGRITPEGYISEAYRNGAPNENTPLGWMHALALIAYFKFSPEYQEKLRTE